MMNYSKKDKLAQRLLVGIPNKESVNGVINLIKNHHIGGVILYKNNYNNLDELINLINKLKEANKDYDIPLTIAIDQEGGRVNRLPKEFENIKSAYRLANSGYEAVKKASHITASILNDLGINMNFAPVLDVKKQNNNDAFIGNRAFSSNIDEIIKCATIYNKEHEKLDVIPVIKHFPGHGSINIDSHIFLPIIKNFTDKSEDLKPFKRLMEENCAAIMVGHILIPGYTDYRPASLSKRFVSNFIKDKLKYKGLVVTDELGMRAVRFFFGKNRSIKLAYEALNDIVCCKYSNDYIEKVLRILEEDSNIDESSIDILFDKVVNYKRKYHFNDKLVDNNFNLDKINKEIVKLNNLEEKSPE